MRVLVDSNVLLRPPQRNDPTHPDVRNALRTLRAQGNDLHYTSQVLGEFWNVSTRPATARGGFGLSTTEAERRVRLIEREFRLLPDHPRVHQEWRRLVTTHAVVGVQVHDARIVASMLASDVQVLLTFNTRDFARFPGITLLDPRYV